MRHLPSHRALRAFTETVRLGNLTAAARALNVTPGAISRQLTSLEDDIGQPLLHRSRQGIVLTARGRALADALSGAFRDIEAAVVQASRRDDRALLMLNTYPTFAIQWLMPRLAQFHADLPQIDLRIQTSLNPPDFERDDIDLGIVIAKDIGPEFDGLHLMERIYAPVCSPALLERCGDAALDEIISAERALVTDMQMAFWRRWLEAAAVPERVLNGAVRFESSSLAWQAARDGAGFAIGQLALLRSDLKSGALVAPFATRILDDRNYYLVGRKAHQHPEDIAAVIDWFSEQIEAVA